MISVVHSRLTEFLASARPSLVPAFGEDALPLRVDDFERVVIVPGGPSGDVGRVEPPKYLGGTPPEIASVSELFRVYVGAYDPDVALDDQQGQALGQYRRTIELWKLVFAGLRRSVRNFWPASVAWKQGDMAAPFGRAILTVASVRESVLDWGGDDDSISIGPVEPLVAGRIAGIEDL